jgi:hypothetical protein
MKNAITILVDSVIWDCIGTTRCKVSSTPFLDSLRSESITASKLYSHGPYTNAATRSLYTGRRCLDDFAYFFNLNTSPTNHYKVFHDNGYETYGLYYPYYMVGRDMRKDIDHTYYTAGFIWGSEWGGIFSYYSEVIKSRSLNNDELKLLYKRVGLMLEVWGDFYKDALNDPNTVSMISDVIEDSDLIEAHNVVEEEIKKFKQDQEAYIYEILQKGKAHKLASLDSIDVDKKINRDYLKKGVYEYYSDFFKFASFINFKANWIKNKPSLKRIINCLVKYVKTHDKDDIMLIANYFMCINSINKVKKESYSHWQDVPSAKTQLDFAIKILENRNTSSKPFYMSLHFLEPHNYLSFFTFDCQDRVVLDEEFEMLYKYCKDLGHDFIGNLAYFLSIRYTDYCIEKFCRYLKKAGLWDNTVLTVVSDHGSSYSFYPLHGRHVNCFDEECYHVAMQIRNPGGKAYEINDYHNSLDVLPTLYDIMGFDPQEGVLGHSMLNQDIPHKNYVMTEYMGPGCPDIMSRPIWFSIRDKHYAIGYKVGIYQNFEDGILAEVYDLSLDPHGFYNIAAVVDKNKIQYLLSHLKVRLSEVRESSYKFISNI